MRRIARQVAELRSNADRVLVVTSAAIASGLAALGFDHRPSDTLTLQAVSAVGMSRLMHRWDEAFAAESLVSGQVLLTPNDFFDRTQYLHARSTLIRLLDLGVIPIINENDAIASDEIRFGDNDRIAALVAHLVNADVLVLLTDTAGLYTANPKTNPGATLIDLVEEVTPELEAVAGGVGSDRGSGGMSSKLRAAKIASWSGIRSVIAGSRGERALLDAVEGVKGCGTVVLGHDRRLSARKLWIAFAGDTVGTIDVDAGAETALRERGVSLLPAGVQGIRGAFQSGDLVEITGPSGMAFARGMARLDSAILQMAKGKQSNATDGEVAVHRDDLVLLP